MTARARTPDEPTPDPRIAAMRWCHHHGRAHLWLGQATACGRNPRTLERAAGPYCTTCLAYAQGWIDCLDHDPYRPGRRPDPAIPWGVVERHRQHLAAMAAQRRTAPEDGAR